eukprot:NODE_10089_length_610_cov_129.507187_g9815_i0.p1 GENE.NODE_10089_length_610_cov_129.507187_g9815_i0~~NODE_10089_length_610_cov_129.507187_g9815_i0.p1  ORF type:complete len:126 (-),score=11.53 NODE_10089_length_610_cov_129.507187_g9815_i0:127-504(-)
MLSEQKQGGQSPRGPENSSVPRHHDICYEKRTEMEATAARPKDMDLPEFQEKAPAIIADMNNTLAHLRATVPEAKGDVNLEVAHRSMKIMEDIIAGEEARFDRREHPSLARRVSRSLIPTRLWNK